MKVRELLDDASKWTRGAFAANVFGEHVPYDAPSAACWCLRGAIFRCYGRQTEQSERVSNLVYATLDAPIATWNDCRGRKFADVKALVEELDI